MIHIYLITVGIVDLVLSFFSSSVISTNNTRLKSSETKEKITKTVHINKYTIYVHCQKI
jgi:hypothetical protein